MLKVLLTIVRSWVAAGSPMVDATTSDDFAIGTRMMRGILAHAGIPGTFDAQDGVRASSVSEDDQELQRFTVAARESFGTSTWTTKELLARVDTLVEPCIPEIALPHALAEKLAKDSFMGSRTDVLNRPLGKWLQYRQGRFVGEYAIRAAGEDRKGYKLWKVVTPKEDQTGT